MDVVIYSRGDAEQIERQRDRCQAAALQAGWAVAGVASDSETTTTGWEDANTLVRDGKADKILVISRSVVPNMIESVTAEIVARVPGRQPGRRPQRINPPD